MKFYLGLILLLTFVFFVNSASAQQFTRGKPSELKGLTKVLVNSEPDIASRAQIVALINAAKLAKLEIVESEDEAEILIVFVNDTESTEKRGQLRNFKVGKGSVSIVGKNIRGQRILMTYQSVDDGSAVKKEPAIAFAKEFVKNYKKANHLK